MSGSKLVTVGGVAPKLNEEKKRLPVLPLVAHSTSSDVSSADISICHEKCPLSRYHSLGDIGIDASARSPLGSYFHPALFQVGVEGGFSDVELVADGPHT